MTTGKIPKRRTGHTAIIYQSSMFVFGGYGNNLWEYQFQTKKWREWKCTGNKLPPVRDNSVAAVHSDRLWIFYGSLRRGESFTNAWSISLLSGSIHQWEEINQIGDQPTSLNRHAVAVARGYMFAIGELIII